jgi:hypothetical protein
MANISSPEDLNVGLVVNGSSWTARMIWANPTGVAYDKVLIAWRRTDGVNSPPPGSNEIDSNINTFTVGEVPPSAAYVFSVKGGQKTDIFGAGINWDYSDWTEFAVSTPALPVVIAPGGRQLVSYARSGAAFSAPIAPDSASRPVPGGNHQIGGWENDWTQVVGIHDLNGDPFLLFYKPNGAAFVAPIVMGDTGGPGNGPSVVIGGWETDWTQIVGFTFDRSPFLLFYRQSKQPTAFVAPIVRGPQSPINGTPTSIGNWEQDWTQIAAFTLSGSPFFLLYRQGDGAAFVAPIVMGAQGPQNGPTQPLVGWVNAPWDQIRAFDFNGSSFVLLYRNDGAAFIAPIAFGPNGVEIGQMNQVGGWEANWAQFAVLSFL